MKLTIALILAGFLATPLWAADAADEVKAAAQKLANQANYSWTAKVESPQQERAGGEGNRREGGRQGRGRGGFGRGGFGAPPSGKTEKDGFTILTFTGRSNTTTEVVVKAGKVAMKSGDEWSTTEELADAGDGDGGGFNPARMTARRAEQAKLPPAEATELLGRATNLKKEGDVYSGELTPEGLKEMFTFRGRGRGQGGNNADRERPAPNVSGLKGTAKFWVKDGVLAKYESHVAGKMPFGGRDGGEAREFDATRTTTVEIKDIGSTKVVVPAEAKKKLKG
jgi:hypothetical protein